MSEYKKYIFLTYGNKYLSKKIQTILNKKFKLLWASQVRLSKPFTTFEYSDNDLMIEEIGLDDGNFCIKWYAKERTDFDINDACVFDLKQIVEKIDES